MKKVTVFAALVVLLLAAQLVQAQPEPVPIVTPVLIDSAVYNGIYTGFQSQIYCEPTTGNLVTAWYRYYSSDSDPRRITAATSIDGGQSWMIHEAINFGVGDHMNARYATVAGTPMTPLIGYSDRNPGGDNRDSRPTVAYDIAGWNGGAFVNLFVDDGGSADTVLYGRYVSLAVAPSNNDMWAVGTYHREGSNRAMFYYYTKDAGASWHGPSVVASSFPVDSGRAIWFRDLSFIGMGVGIDNSNNVMSCFRGQVEPDDNNALWMVLYSMSSDFGQTWTAPATIPGSEHLYTGTADTYRPVSSPIVDKDGNWHIFVIAIDTLETPDWNSVPQPYRAFDFRYDGSTWTVDKFVFPSFLENGIIAWGDFPPDIETYQMNEPAIGPDGTLYYAYTDVIDTTGAMGKLDYYNFAIKVMFSEDNGDTWQGPVTVLEQWEGRSPNGMAKYATDKLHIVYRQHFDSDKTDLFWYIGVPTDTVKALATKVDQRVSKVMPEDFALHQNYPNPFNPTTNITFDLAQSAKVTLKIYNELGQEVATLIDQKQMDAGFKGITWHASDLPSGVYIYKLTAGSYSATKKMILTK